jgi:nucleolar protein 58
MGLFILTETSAGYALFKAKDKKLLKSDTLGDDIASAEGTVSALKLKKFTASVPARALLEPRR